MISVKPFTIVFWVAVFSFDQAKAFAPLGPHGTVVKSTSTSDKRQSRSWQHHRRHQLDMTATRETNTSDMTASVAAAATAKIPRANVVFIAGSAPSKYGMTSPEPNPTWSEVAQQLALRLPHFAQSVQQQQQDADGTGGIATRAIEIEQLTPQDLSNTDIVVVLGVASMKEEEKLTQILDNCNNNNKIQAILCDPTCGAATLEKQLAGSYRVAAAGWQSLLTQLAPWSSVASHQRLLQKTQTLLARKSSEDYLFAILFALHSLVTPIDVVASDINPSWEKGVLRNAQEFKTMVDCCGPQIQAALTDPQSKEAIDQLNALDLRDQVGSYRVIVSNETPQLEEFTLCILQQNNCFQCDAPILTQPQVPLMETWQGKPLDAQGAKQIFMGHLNHPDAADCSQQHAWSWKIVVGANPAYDAFPLQHQIFYPSGSKGKGSGGSGAALWYDPVFCVETLQGDLVWCKRHYRCTPRRHWSGRKEGAWTLSTLDNGMVSEEHWTTVDAADDLSWAVLHYSGAARRAGQSYVGALLCTPDGEWPTKAKSGPELERIRTAFRHCDLELWELFGGSTEQSYMWSSKFTDWAAANPPPLDLIGDISITTWRKQERERELQEQKQKKQQ